MKSRTRRNSKKKTLGLALLVACLALVAIGGTIAWLTAQDSLTNQFAVGNFNNPTNPDDEGNTNFPEDTEDILKGHLYEPDWKPDEAKIMPGAEIAKNPMVGIGEGSEQAYVYIYIDNTINKNLASGPVYFTIDEDWEAVESYSIEVTDVVDVDPGYVAGTKYYAGGLFRYEGTGDGVLTVETGKKNAWTTALFDSVYVKQAYDVEALNVDDEGKILGNITVTALLHQVYNNNEASVVTLAGDADTWAKAQAKELNTRDDFLNATP